MIINTIDLSSPAFYQEGFIPSDYTCDGRDISPPLTISAVPDNAKSLALIMEDPDAPLGTWDHWIIWNIDPVTRYIDEGKTPIGAISGTNSFKKLDYGGPCPPFRTHRYVFKIYALDTSLDIPVGSKKNQLKKAMHSHVIAEGLLLGKYGKKRK